MQPVECCACGNRVLVEKFSHAHTSVQWTTTASRCARFAIEVERGANSAFIATCPTLSDSIEQAVRDGYVAVGPSEGTSQ